MAKEITTANFETEVLKSEKPVLIDFWATWCGPCMRQGPVVEELAEEGYAVGKVDVDQNMALAQQFRVVSIPTLILFKDGAEVKRFVVMWQDFRKMLKQERAYLFTMVLDGQHLQTQICRTKLSSLLSGSVQKICSRNRLTLV